MMTNRHPVSAILLFFAFASYPGCSQSGGSAAISGNASDARIVVERVEADGGSYRLHGRVVSAVPVGSTVSMAETGQELTLSPYYSEESDAAATPAGERLARLATAASGDTIACRIALDSRGAWRIISVE